MPSPRRLRSRSDSGSLLQLPQAGGRLVEDHEHRIGGKRARDFEHALLAERQIAGEVAELLAKADALQLMQRLGARGAFLGAVEAKRAGEETRARARIGAEQHVVDQRHVRPQLDVLERARHALAAIWRGASAVMSSPRNTICPALGFAVPVIRLSSVVLPAPFGPIRPRISPARTSKLTSLTAASAAEPLGGTVDPQHGSIG